MAGRGYALGERELLPDRGPVRLVISVTFLLTVVACAGGSGPSSPSAPVPASTPPAFPSPGAMLLRSAVLRGANGHAAAGIAPIVGRPGAHPPVAPTPF